MAHFEYKVIPAPTKGRKAPGFKSAEARFAHGLEEAMNELASDGWEYVRSDLLPSEERQGLTSSHTVYRSVLVFRRPTPADTTDQPAPPAADTAEDTQQDTDLTSENQEIEANAEPLPDTEPHWIDEGIPAREDTRTS